MSKDVVFLGDKTLSLLARNLNAEFEDLGAGWRALDAGYDSWLVAPLDPQSPLYAENTVAWAFALSPRVLEYVDDFELRVAATLERLRSMSKPPTVFFANIFIDPNSVAPLTTNLERQRIADRVNARLLQFRDEHAWFHVIDQIGLVLRHGLSVLYDARFEASAQLYFSPAGTRMLSKQWARALCSLERPQKKVCVVDLDNTLWGGILGEDGPEGLQMADTGVGFAYRRFQRSLQELRRDGVLLAVCSKNNAEEALRVLSTHPDCLLQPEDFADLEIGWGLKSEAIRRTAEKLSLGLDSFVFIDDSPVERAEVKNALPMVDVLEYPEDPVGLVAMLAEYSGFDVLRQTDEDRRRAQLYVQEAKRVATRAEAATPEEFFRSLEIHMQIFSPHADQTARLHQLVLKTNQFNLTARRPTADEFRDLLANPAIRVLGLRVSDRFGDSGVTGVAIIDHGDPESWQLQDFLLSCRVIGRTVESAFLSWLIGRAAASGARRVVVRYRATGRNDVAHQFLVKSGGLESEGGAAWIFATQAQLGLPPHFVAIEDKVTQ